jgi:hypothetical protein
VTVSSANAPLPPGSSFVAKNGAVTVSIAGPGCAYPSGFDATVSLVLTDPIPCYVGFKCTAGPASVAVTLANAC